MPKHYNPYHLHSGVFVPHYLLSSSSLSHGAKLLYALLASKADSRGEVLLHVALMTAELGEEEHNIFRLMNELDTGGSIRTERHPAGTQFIRCFFPQPAWLLHCDASTKSSELPPTASPKLPTRSISAQPFELFESLEQSEHEKTESPIQTPFSSEAVRQLGSRYSLEDCYKYALACQQAGQRIKNPYRLAKALHKTGEQDEEIALVLATGQKQGRAKAA